MGNNQLTVDEMVPRYEELYLPAISDVLDNMGYPHQWLGREIKSVSPTGTVAGVAFTISYTHSLHATEEEAIESDTNMLDEIKKNHVIVSDNAGNEMTGLWGGLSALVAKQKGARGLVLDGGVRDTSYILEHGLPIFARYTSPLDTLGRFKIKRTNVEISVNDISISPGDVMVADMDGVICVPKEIAEDVLLEAESLVENEQKIRQALKEGKTPTEVGREYGHF